MIFVSDNLLVVRESEKLYGAVIANEAITAFVFGG